ncbi:MAG: DUF2165 family protein [Pseudomonadota bacterium]
MLVVQAVALACVAVWMTVAVRDNWQHPDLNLDAIAMVMRLDLMERDWPEDYVQVAHRRVTEPRIHKLAFRAVVTAETLAAAALWISALLLLLSAGGAVAAEIAKAAAALSLVWFVAIWAGFIAGGNYFCYWYCHHSSQTTHYFLLLWGLLTLILVAVA